MSKRLLSSVICMFLALVINARGIQVSVKIDYGRFEMTRVSPQDDFSSDIMLMSDVTIITDEATTVTVGYALYQDGELQHLLGTEQFNVGPFSTYTTSFLRQVNFTSAIKNGKYELNVVYFDEIEDEWILCNGSDENYIIILVEDLILNAYNPRSIDGICYNFDPQRLEAVVYGKDDPSLTNVVLPNTVTHNGREYRVTKIAENALRYSEIESLVISNSIDTIGNGALYMIPNLKSVTLGENVRYIGEGCFSYCPSLTEVKFNKKLQYIGPWAFKGYNRYYVTEPDYPKISNFEIPQENPFFRSIDGTICSPDGTCLILYPPYREDVVIPSSVTNIADFAFSGCAMTEANLPSTVIRMGGYNFWSCQELRHITFPQYLDTIPRLILADTPSLESVVWPENCKVIDEQAFCQSGIKELNIPNSVEIIGVECFVNASIEKLHLGSGVRFLGQYIDTGSFLLWDYSNAFLRLSSLKEITVDSNNKWLSSYKGLLYDKSESVLLFCPYNIEELDETSFAPTLTVIEEEAFRECRLKRLTLPSSLSITNYASLLGCSELTSLTLLAPTTNLHPTTLSLCSSLKDIYLHARTPDKAISNGLLDYVPESCTIHVPNGYTDAYTEEVNKGGYSFDIIDDLPVETELTPSRDYGYWNGIEHKDRYASLENALSDNILSVGMLIPKSELLPYKNCIITSLVFQGTCTTEDSLRVFIAYSVNGQKIASIPFPTVPFHEKWRKIAFPEPYTINCEEDLFIGVDFPEFQGIHCTEPTVGLNYNESVPANTLWYNNSGNNWQPLPSFQSFNMAVTIEGFIKGDVNGDDIIDADDVKLTAGYITSNNADGSYVNSADMNDDGKLDITDLTAFIKKILESK